MSEKNSIVAVYKSHAQAEDAVRELQKSGFDMKKLSIVGKDYHTDEHVVGYYNTGDRMMYWGKLGAFWGGFWGLLFGSAFFWVPGIGPLVVAGPLVTWIVGARRRRCDGRAHRSRRGTVQHRDSEGQRRAIRDRGEKRQTSPGCPRNGRRGAAGQGPLASDWSGGSNGSWRTGRRRRVTMAMEDQHDHGHHHGPPRRKLHHDWHLWLVVGLMLAAMLMYVLSDNERFGLGRGTGKISPPVPAMP